MSRGRQEINEARRKQPHRRSDLLLSFDTHTHPCVRTNKHTSSQFISVSCTASLSLSLPFLCPDTLSKLIQFKLCFSSHECTQLCCFCKLLITPSFSYFSALHLSFSSHLLTPFSPSQLLHYWLHPLSLPLSLTAWRAVNYHPLCIST